MGATLCQPGRVRPRGSSASWTTAQSHVRTRTAPQPPRRSRPAPARLALLPVELSRPGDRLGAPHRSPAWSRKCPLGLKKNALSSCQPTGQLTPTSAALASASIDLAALDYRAQRGEIILLYADETVLWRFALPRAGWWHSKARRFRVPTRPLSPSQIRGEEGRKRQAWGRYRSWSRVTHGVLLSVMGAVQYGTSKVFYKVVPQFDTEGFRQYIHHIMALFGHTGPPVVMVVDRSGIHRAHKLASTLAHWQKPFRLH